MLLRHKPVNTPPPLFPWPQALGFSTSPSRSLLVETAPSSSPGPWCLDSRRWSASSGWLWASRARSETSVWWEWCAPGPEWHLFCLLVKLQWSQGFWVAWIFSFLGTDFPGTETDSFSQSQSYMATTEFICNNNILRPCFNMTADILVFFMTSVLL